MNAEIVAIPKLGADKVRQSADTHLQAGAVGHQARNRAADHLVLWRRRANRQLQQRDVVLDDCIDLRDMQLAPAQLTRGIFSLTSTIRCRTARATLVE